MTQLRISRAAVSGAVQYLSNVALLRRERQAGSRREHYALQDETWYEGVAQRQRILDHWIRTTRTGIEALGATTPAGTRLSESLAFFEFLRHEMATLLTRWRETQTIPQRRRRQ